MTTPPADPFEPQDADNDAAAWADAPLPECWSFAGAWYSAHAAIRNAGVIGLDDAVAQCAMAVARQQAAGTVPRLLFVGATGKSMLMHATAEAICHATGRTFITLSGATLSPSGWEGLTLRQALRNTPNAVVCLDAIDSMVVAVDEHTRGNTVAHRESLAADLRSLMVGAFTCGLNPPVLATASLQRLSLPQDRSVTPQALREAGMDASLATMWQPVLLPALDPAAMREILHALATTEANTISHATGYEVVWTALALPRAEGLILPRVELERTAESPGRDRWLTAEELRKVEEAFGKLNGGASLILARRRGGRTEQGLVPTKCWWPLFALLAQTGMRLGEALALRWDEVRFSEGVIRVREGLRDHRLKTGSSYRKVPLSDALVATLVAHRAAFAQVDDVRVFPAIAFVTRRMQGLWSRAVAAAGIEHATIHDLRHTFAVHALEAGVPLNVLQAILGHSDALMVLKYVRRQSEGRTAEVGELVARSLAGTLRPQDDAAAKLVREQFRLA